MSQRNSGYKRIKDDGYQTPEWVTEALLSHLPRQLIIWEPACGTGRMVAVLRQAHAVTYSDISQPAHGHRLNFLRQYKTPAGIEAIITNPPYEYARRFIEHALKLTEPCKGRVAMLLRTDFDHATTRRHLFAEHPAFACKLVLTKRIIWFKKKDAAPSYNHAWFLWDWKHQGPPTLAYGP